MFAEPIAGPAIRERLLFGLLYSRCGAAAKDQIFWRDFRMPDFFHYGEKVRVVWLAVIGLVLNLGDHMMLQVCLVNVLKANKPPCDFFISAGWRPCQKRMVRVML